MSDLLRTSEVVHSPIEVAAGVQRRISEGAAPAVRVRALVPCHDRPDDLTQLLSDLSLLELSCPQGVMTLEVIIVDNASSTALPDPPAGSAIRLVRSETNLGGSGGFNLALRTAIGDWDRTPNSTDLLWLIDSDARVRPDTLSRMVDALASDPLLVAVGPALADPKTRQVHEVGGVIDRRSGRQGPMLRSTVGVPGVVTCDYVASCCLLARRQCVERAGLMPDRFVNADDAEWCIRLASINAGAIGVTPDAVAFHPRFDRFPTWQRYFGSRNAFGPIDALGFSRRVRFRAAIGGVAKAINQTLMGRDDLADLHMLGLRDAARGVTTGPAGVDVQRPATRATSSDLRSIIERLPPGASIGMDEEVGTLAEREPGVRELVELARQRSCTVVPRSESRRRGMTGAFWRWLAGPAFDLAIVPARGAACHWFAADTLVCIAEGGAWVTRPSRRSAWRSLVLAVRGGVLATRIALGERTQAQLPAAPIVQGFSTPTLSIVVLSYNRSDALVATLEKLAQDPATRDAETIVVDNASTDDSAALVRAKFPHVTLLELPTNVAIAGFNRGVAAATGDTVLVLDDDAHPEPGVVSKALDLLGARPDLAAVTFLPTHPRSGVPEWRFANVINEACADWPTMGCANLVRKADWLAAGGYDESFFLYRNDTDLALKLLAMGRGVWFDPAWVAWHDSPAAASKSARWFRLATRNWIWMCRRHARGMSRLGAILAGWLWAHRLAGLSLAAQAAVFRGALSGVASRVAPVSSGSSDDGRGLRRLLSLQRRARGKG